MWSFCGHTDKKSCTAVDAGKNFTSSKNIKYEKHHKCAYKAIILSAHTNTLYIFNNGCPYLNFSHLLQFCNYTSKSSIVINLFPHQVHMCICNININ